MKELDKIKNAGHFDFELFLEGSDVVLEIVEVGRLFFFTHGKLKKLLELNRKK
jgi:hypothetical protein